MSHDKIGPLYSYFTIRKTRWTMFLGTLSQMMFLVETGKRNEMVASGFWGKPLTLFAL